MMSMVLKILLLLLYLVLMSAMLRLCELLVWYEAGFVATQLVDPVTLSVNKLKNLLDVRGINYEKVVEKKELSDLIAESGDVHDGELMEIQEDGELEENDTTLFRSRGHFYEEVEDKKDSVWVIQVVPPDRPPLHSKNSWKTIRRKVSKFGIRTGTFNCSLDTNFCLMKNWLEQSVLLAMPQGETYKDHVTMFHYYKPSSASYILDRLNAHLMSKVTRFYNLDNAKPWMEMARNRPNQFPVRIAYFSSASEPPLFFSSLGAKFTGRIKFAFISTNKRQFSEIKNSKKIKTRIPSILIATSEGDVRYGIHAGEYMSYDKLVLYLKTLSPEINDAFIWSLFAVNILCVFDFFITQGGILKRFVYFSWTFGKSNFSFLAFWLPFLGTLQLSVLKPVWNFGNKILRKFLISDFMCYIRSDLLVYSHYTTFLLLTFLIYCCVIGFIEKYRKRLTNVSQESNAAWLHRVIQDYYMFLIRPSSNLRGPRLNRVHVEEGLDMLIERLAVPGFWLHPVIPMDYISNLPTWKFCGGKGTENVAFDEENGTDVNKLNSSCSSNSLDNQNVSFSQNDDVMPASGRVNHGDVNQVTDSNQNVNSRSHDKGSSTVYRERECTTSNYNTCLECAICLEVYHQNDTVCGLPCGHVYHHGCIVTWLRGGNHCCPKCRWPAYKTKGCKLLKYQE
ncbi:E3 ubiquitin-protein ligase RNF103-like [Antedon mediterranea]|uniref:E3 ubiquitin-protein ligase RNF103-like n=1 Tax=Antedon mediterranea TaxID=105859 RepID=UPI003AF67630